MNVIPFHGTNSKTVEKYSDIEKEARELKVLSDTSFFGKHQTAYALHHSQVSEKPFNFFVLSSSGSRYLPEWLIINPRILARRMRYRVPEGCMSFQFRDPTTLWRWGSISVEFQVRTPFSDELRTVKKDLEGIAAQIFQHEFDHGFGKSIYD